MLDSQGPSSFPVRMFFAPHLSKLHLPIPLGRSGIHTDATTNSKACSSSHLTSKMTYSRVRAVTRTAVLIKEGSVFCIALKKKLVETGDFRQTNKSLSKRAEQSKNGNSMDSPLKETDFSSPGSPMSIDSGNDELQMLFLDRLRAESSQTLPDSPRIRILNSARR